MVKPPLSDSVTRQHTDVEAMHIPRRVRDAPLTLQTSFVGREREVARVCALLMSDQARLVTLTGPGGSGKTRLALRVVAELADAFRHGTVFIPLSPIKDAGLVLSTIANALGIHESSERSIFDLLAAALNDREMLLLLDNFEQILPAAVHIADLLAVCPNLQVLVTSRAVLRVYGERAVPVPPLELPESGSQIELAEARNAAAVRLFEDRAQAREIGFTVSPGNFRAVVDICRRLDGLPLAIELAAARIAHLPPEALLSRLTPSLPMLTGGARNLPERLRTVRAAVAWSYDLLIPEEQALFGQLAVFVGGFTLPAAESVANTGNGQKPNVMECVASLVDQSLLYLVESEADSEPRYSILETIREFGLELLIHSDAESPVRAAHASWYADFCERAQQGFETAEQHRWLRETELEQPNIRGVLGWSLEGGHPEPGFRICSSLGWFWWARGDPREGRSWLEKALARSTSIDAIVVARLQTQLAEILWSLGDYDAASDLDHQALGAFRAVDDWQGIAACLLNLGRIAQDVGNYPESRGYFERSLELFREIGDHSNVVRCLGNLGMVSLFEGDLGLAAKLQNEALVLAKENGQIHSAAKISFNLGEVQRRRGYLAPAIGLYEESLIVHEQLRERRFVAEALRGLARVAAAMGDLTDAAILAGADESIREAIAARITPEPEREAYERTIAGVRASLGDDAFKAAKASGRQFQINNREVVSEAISRLQQRALHKQEAQPPNPGGLSARELEVLALLAQGLSDREIGDALFISHRTVNGHVARMFEKLGINSRAEAAVAAVKLGIVPN